MDHVQSMTVQNAGESRLQLKSLYIAGFKSFARPVVLEFPPGITAFVGANGSGKSNVVDAIRWCLGEQSVRDLRGQRTEDVIHAGRRRVLGSAEVSLSFEGTGPGEQDLHVSRKLLRSGESEYIVDGSRRRLRDVQASLSHLGIDHPRFVVVSQGMTDFLLSATALERRALLEQAAGLASYRQHREDAAQKLASAERNMVTAEAVLAELDPRVRALQRQVRAIEARDHLVSQLRERERIWYTLRRAEASESLRSAEIDLQRANVERDCARERLRTLEEDARRAIKNEREWQRQVETATAGVYRAQRDAEVNSHRSDSLTSRAADLQRARNDLKRRQQESESELTAARSRQSRSYSELEVSRAALVAAVDLEAKTRDGVLALEKESARVEESARAISELARGREDELSELRTKLAALEAEWSDSTARCQRLESASAAARREIEELTESIEAATRASRDAQQVHRGSEKHLSHHTAEIQALDSRLSRIRTAEMRLDQQVSYCEAGIESARRVHLALEAEMAETVFAGLRVASGAETAVGAALYSWRTGARMLDDGDAGFLRWRDGLSPYMEGTGRWLDALVDSPDGIPAALAGTIVVASEAEAEGLWERLRRLSGHSIGSPAIQVATRDGMLFSSLGRRLHANDNAGTRFLVTVAEKERLETSLRRLHRNMARLATVAERTVNDRRQVAEQLEMAQREVQAAQNEVAVARARLDALAAHRERLSREAAITDRELGLWRDTSARLAPQLADLRNTLATLTDSAGQAERRRAVSETEVSGVRARLELARRAEAAAAGDARILQRRIEVLREIATRADSDVMRLERQPDQLAQELERVEQELDANRASLDTVKQQGAEFAAVLSEREAGLRSIRAQSAPARDLSPELRAARDLSDKAVARLERMTARRDELAAAQLRLESEIVREMGTVDLGMSDVRDGDDPTEEEIRRLRARAAQYAEYDPAVLSEYHELEERKTYLTLQISDLKAAALGLREVMALADSEMRSRFSQALEIVSEEFDRVLQVMVRGGRAALHQELDGGVEVRASLPGKRPRSSASFSGGERALVATALLFAVLRIRPAPFCVLDEVDAALDESNVDRYLGALRDLGNRTQTLVVTHNRATMAAATALYGLTIDGDGASSLLSLRLDQFDAAVS